MSTMSLLFFIRRNRGNDDVEAPIYMRVTIAGDRYELSTKRLVPPADSGRVKGNTTAAKSLNSFLDSLLSKAYSHQRHILNEGKEFSMTEFKNRWLGVSTERIYMLMEIFEEHNAQMKALVRHEFSPLTLERYTTSKKHTQEFMKWKYKVEDMDIRKLNYGSGPVDRKRNRLHAFLYFHRRWKILDRYKNDPQCLKKKRLLPVLTNQK